MFSLLYSKDTCALTLERCRTDVTAVKRPLKDQMNSEYTSAFTAEKQRTRVRSVERHMFLQVFSNNINALTKRNGTDVTAVERHLPVLPNLKNMYVFTPERSPTNVSSVGRPLHLQVVSGITWVPTVWKTNCTAVTTVKTHLSGPLTSEDTYPVTLERARTAVNSVERPSYMQVVSKIT